MSAFPIEDALKPECDSLRADLLAIEKRARAARWTAGEACWKAASDGMSQPAADQMSEILAQVDVAVRHIEDARMRIGKVLQYARDGVSCFDHAKETP